MGARSARYAKLYTQLVGRMGALNRLRVTQRALYTQLLGRMGARRGRELPCLRQKANKSNKSQKEDSNLQIARGRRKKEEEEKRRMKKVGQERRWKEDSRGRGIEVNEEGG